MRYLDLLLGVAIGVYCTLLFLSTDPVTPLSYFIDDGEAVHFNISNPSKIMGQLIDLQLVLQTPPLSRGVHSLHMTLPGQDTGDGTQIDVRAVIVQNTTNANFLDTVPSTSSTSTSIVATPSSHNIPSLLSSVGHGTGLHVNKKIIIVIGGMAGVIIAAILILLAIRAKRRWLRNKTTNISKAAIPFSVQRDNRAATFILSRHIVSEKADRYREALEHPTRELRRVSSDEEDTDGQTSESRDAPSRLRRVRYRVHEDAEEANRLEDDDEGEVIVSLPPMYRPHRRVSAPPDILAPDIPPAVHYK